MLTKPKGYVTDIAKKYAEYGGDNAGRSLGNILPPYVAHMVKDSSIT